MDIRKIHRNIVNSRVPLIIVVLVFVAFRMFWIDENRLLELWASMFIQIGMAFFLMSLTQRHIIIRGKTLLPAFCYLLLSGTNYLFIYNLRGSISAFLVVLCLWFLFNTYQKPFSQRNALNISLVLAAGSLYWAPLLYFFPLFWCGMYWFKSLNFKTFLASLMGVAVVCLFLFTWSVYADDWTVFATILSDLRTLGDFRFPSFRIWNMAEIIFVGFLFILSIIKIFMAGVSEKAQAKTMLSYFSLLTFAIFILFLFQNQWMKEWLLILYIPISLLIAHYFSLAQSRAVMWLFLATIVFSVLMFGWKWFALP